MSIKTFEEFQVDHEQLFEAKAAFNAAVKMCKAHYEEEAIATHEYYDKQFKDLAKGNTEEDENPVQV